MTVCHESKNIQVDIAQYCQYDFWMALKTDHCWRRTALDVNQCLFRVQTRSAGTRWPQWILNIWVRQKEQSEENELNIILCFKPASKYEKIHRFYWCYVMFVLHWNQEHSVSVLSVSSGPAAARLRVKLLRTPPGNEGRHVITTPCVRTCIAHSVGKYICLHSHIVETCPLLATNSEQPCVLLR